VLLSIEDTIYKLFPVWYEMQGTFQILALLTVAGEDTGHGEDFFRCGKGIKNGPAWCGPLVMMFSSQCFISNAVAAAKP
jgi:hypothetical protein